MYRHYGKRLLDLTLVIPAITLLAPLMGLIALLVHMRIGAPVLFRQERPGLDGKLFTLYKFRTMLDLLDQEGHPLPDEQRLTRFGCWLRSTSLDELPELWNVLRGDMSLVGPRPLLASYLNRYSPEQAHRHAIQPGITGWAQINGRNTVAWEQRFALDLWYIHHLSLRLDLQIIILTMRAVLVREGINQVGHVTMEEFHGS